MIEYIEINDSKNLYFLEFLDIYNNSFPENERNPVEKIIFRIENNLSKLIVNLIDNKVVAFAFVAELDNNFVLFDYLAVKKEFQNLGLGSKFIDFIKNSLNNKVLILEVENPLFGDNKILKNKRIEFYKRKNIKILENIRYILPPLDNSDNFTEMILMYYSEKQNFDFNKNIIKHLIIDIYNKIYNRNSYDF